MSSVTLNMLAFYSLLVCFFMFSSSVFGELKKNFQNKRTVNVYCNLLHAVCGCLINSYYYQGSTCSTTVIPPHYTRGVVRGQTDWPWHTHSVSQEAPHTSRFCLYPIGSGTLTEKHVWGCVYGTLVEKKASPCAWRVNLKCCNITQCKEMLFVPLVHLIWPLPRQPRGVCVCV